MNKKTEQDISQTASHTIFQDNWSPYAYILKQNVMHHADAKISILKMLKQLFALGTPIQMADLGCGDAVYISDIISNFSIQQYVGFDLSDNTFPLTKKNLERYGIPYQLYKNDMKDFYLSIPDNKYNLIFSGFAIHHLQHEEKKILFKHIKDTLLPGGFFVYLDVIIHDGYDVKAYVNHICGLIEKLPWDHMSKELLENTLADIRYHISTFDMPATDTWLQQEMSLLQFKTIYKEVFNEEGYMKLFIYQNT